MPIGGDFMDKRSDKTYHRQYIKNKKKFLQMEIKNTADPDTKLALTKLLIEIERREKKYRIIGMTLIIVLCLISFLLYLGNQSMKNDLNANNNQQQNSPTPSSSLESTSTESSVIESSAIETHLSAEQIEQWVMSVLELAPPVPTRYLLSTYLDDKDNLVYVRAGVDQFDNVGLFRVNAKGHLEYLSRIPGADWVLMSDKYMDTSIAEEYYKNLENTYHNDKDTISEEELPIITNENEEIKDSINSQKTIGTDNTNNRISSEDAIELAKKYMAGENSSMDLESYSFRPAADLIGDGDNPHYAIYVRQKAIGDFDSMAIGTIYVNAKTGECHWA